jgi:hypothetical protein
MYDIYLTNPVTGGTLTGKHYGIYQEHSGDNYFSGSVGIGTASPGEKLEIQKSNAEGSTFIKLSESGTLGDSDVGIDWYMRTNQDKAGRIATERQGAAAEYDMVFYGWSGGTAGSSVDYMRIDQDGNVGIGEPDPNSKLAVNGTITAKEVEVTESGWSDFVFQDDYDLLPLDKVESYIRQNKHLPDIPSEREVKEKGLAVSGMLAKQMQKIEELTLYLIQVKKENEALRGRVAALEEANGPPTKR